MQSEDVHVRDYILGLLARQDTVIHVVSDHGNGNEGWRLPMSALIIPTQFLDKHPEIERNLEANSQRLISHFDMYETLKHFATYPEAPETAAWENKPAASKSLLSNEMSKDRKCNQIGVPTEWCSCVSFER